MLFTSHPLALDKNKLYYNIAMQIRYITLEEQRPSHKKKGRRNLQCLRSVQSQTLLSAGGSVVP